MRAGGCIMTEKNEESEKPQAKPVPAGRSNPVVDAICGSVHKKIVEDMSREEKAKRIAAEERFAQVEPFLVSAVPGNICPSAVLLPLAQIRTDVGVQPRCS